MNVFELVARFVELLANALIIAIILRIILSWFTQPGSEHPILRFLHEVTEPILAPLRRVVPSIGLLDLSPMVAIILIQLITDWVLLPVLRGLY